MCSSLMDHNESPGSTTNSPLAALAANAVASIATSNAAITSATELPVSIRLIAHLPSPNQKNQLPLQCGSQLRHWLPPSFRRHLHDEVLYLYCKVVIITIAPMLLNINVLARRKLLVRRLCPSPPRPLPLYSPSFREGSFSETCTHTPAYLKVPGRRQAGLISELPRRVLLGNWVSGVPPSRKPSFVLCSAARIARSVDYTGPSSQGADVRVQVASIQ